jgi:hypothetical protein
MCILTVSVFMRTTSLSAAPLGGIAPGNSESGGPIYADNDESEDGYVSQLGIITSQSESPSGTWQIGNTSYSVTTQTALDDDNGLLAVGACVEVKAAQNAPTVAIEVDSKETYECNGDDDDDDDDDGDDDADDGDDDGDYDDGQEYGEDSISGYYGLPTSPSLRLKVQGW